MGIIWNSCWNCIWNSRLARKKKYEEHQTSKLNNSWANEWVPLRSIMVDKNNEKEKYIDHIVFPPLTNRNAKDREIIIFIEWIKSPWIFNVKLYFLILDWKLLLVIRYFQSPQNYINFTRKIFTSKNHFCLTNEEIK
jgi:hypothetical protein